MTTDETLRVLIVDDEFLARQRLEDLLSKEDDVEIVGRATNGREAVAALTSSLPDLVFLDVQMAGMSGLEVVEAIGPHNMPAVIFVTAYDQYALQAFDLAALDYLLKPFDDERFEQAFARAKQMVELQKVGALAEQLAALLHKKKPPPLAYLERIAVDLRGQVRVVPVHQIDFITASGPYAELHVGDDTYLIREQMQTLEERLNPDHFFRIHRSAIIRLDLVDALLYSAGGDYAVRLKDGKHLKVSRSRREALEQHLGLTL